MISKIQSVLKRWRTLGGFKTVRFFLNYARINGFVPALVQAYKRLFWGGSQQYFSLYNRWYQRKNIDERATCALDLFQKPHLLIAGALDLPQCKKYRVLQKVELLSKIGVKCSIASYQDIPRVLDKIQLATQLLLYRVPDGNLVQGIINEAQRLGIAVGYDIDDPIFDVNIYRDNPNLEFLDDAEKTALLDSSGRYLNVIKAADFVIVSTPGMAMAVKRHFSGEIIRWPNVIDGETQAILKSLGGNGKVALPVDFETKSSLTIGYMSGSRAHERDFRIIEQPLYELMARCPDVRLLIGGYCNMPDQFEKFNERIAKVPFAGYQGYFSQLKNVDINIVPLVMNEFNECKSAIRFMEAAMLGVPTIASAVGDFNHLIRHGETGFLAQRDQDWTDAFDQLITQPRLRREIGASAREFVMNTNTTEALIPLMKHQLIDLLSRRRNVTDEKASVGC